MNCKHYDIIIVGAGAAGLFSGALLAPHGKKVLLLEHNQSPGKKILISGGGRCNFTNLDSKPEDFISQNSKFCISALKKYPSSKFIELVSENQISFFEKKLGQLFCKESANDILNLLLKLNQNNQILYGMTELQVTSEKNKYYLKNSIVAFSCDHLIVATGGLSIPKIGASPWGYQVAKKLGHKIIEPRPALVPFKLKGFESLSGVSLLAKVKVDKFEIIEEVLFTHKGLSGPAILKASLHWEANNSVKIDWIPNLDKDELKLDGDVTLQKMLSEILPKNFIKIYLNDFSSEMNKKLDQISSKTFNKIFDRLKNFEFKPDGTEGFLKAEATKGGVCTSKVSSQTMESKLSPGLFFVGEVLDVTGQLGGHNFQWAWSSAHAAAKELIKR